MLLPCSFGMSQFQNQKKDVDGGFKRPKKEALIHVTMW